MLGTVLLDARKAQRIVADIAGVVFFLGRLQRAGEVDGQRIVQPGLRLFGGLGRSVRPLLFAEGGEALPGQRLKERILAEEPVRSLLRQPGRLPGLGLFGLAGGQLFFADPAASLI